MKLSYQLVSGGSFEPMFDDSDPDNTLSPPVAVGAGFSPRFNPRLRQANQEEELAFADARFREPRGNVACSWQVQFQVEYETAELALSSVVAFAALLNQKFHLKLEVGDTEVYFPNAVAESYEPDQTGASVTHSFAFLTDNVTETPP